MAMADANGKRFRCRPREVVGGQAPPVCPSCGGAARSPPPLPSRKDVPPCPTANAERSAFWITVSILTPLMPVVGLLNERQRLLHDLLVGTVVINNPARARALRLERPPA